MIWFFWWVFLSDFYNQLIKNNENILESYYDDSRHILELTIDDVYKVDTYNSIYIAKISKIDNSIIDKDIFSLAQAPNNIDIKKWYKILVESKIYKLDNFGHFDYKNYMLSKKIYNKIYINSMQVVSVNNINFIEKYLDNLRQNLLGVINILYPKNEALFLGGILLWAREDLPQELKTNFNNSWLTHFIAVSGFNITILIVFISFLFKYFPIYLRVILITVSIVLFTLLVWDTAPVVRASIMGLIWYYILVSGRKWNTWTILLLSLFIMILFSPLSLNYDVSLHLSFLAVLGIIFTSDFFKKIFYFLPETLAIREAFILTMSAFVFTLPIMMFNFGQVSLIAPISNIAVAWTMPFAMAFGFISILAYFIYPIFWFIIWYLTWIFLHYDMLMVSLFWNMDYMLLSFDVGIYKNYLELLYFIVLWFVILYFKEDKKETQV